MNSNPTARPWFREPMVWLVIALPMTAVVAGLSTLAIAIRSGSTDAVPDVVRRTLQIQDADIAADRRAIELGLRGEIRFDADTGAIEAQMLGLDAGTPALTLRLLHAGRASRDLEVRLVQAGEAWHGRVEGAKGQAWNIELSAADHSWRVGGRLDPGATRSELIPMLSGG
ncbi:MAG: FixH family protein [Aquimonas sp.]